MSPGPLFRHRDGHPLSKPTFIKWVQKALAKLGYDEKGYAGQFPGGCSFHGSHGWYPGFYYKGIGQVGEHSVPLVRLYPRRGTSTGVFRAGAVTASNSIGTLVCLYLPSMFYILIPDHDNPEGRGSCNSRAPNPRVGLRFGGFCVVQAPPIHESD